MTNYELDTDAKTVNDETSYFYWNPNNQTLLVDFENGGQLENISNIYSRGIQQIKNNHDVYYSYNGHGDVIALTNTGSNVTKTYDYNAFGVEINKDENDTNPFRYCGEYFDNEINDIYLRNRYYSPMTGRFITEDPIRDGLNWYAYCGGNPILFNDKFGLFDYNTRLSRESNGSEYNSDVAAMQHRLKKLGYIDMSKSKYGYFDANTENAVNAFKNAQGLGNDGDNKGVVGAQTWTSMGLYYRTQQDIDAGVEVITKNNEQYFDITKAVTNALQKIAPYFSLHMLDTEWFKSQMTNYGKWNVKESAKKWTEALGISGNTFYAPKILNGKNVIADDVGNFAYGYLGTAAGFGRTTLAVGSYYYDVINNGFSNLENEAYDQTFVSLGIDFYIKERGLSR